MVAWGTATRSASSFQSSSRSCGARRCFMSAAGGDHSMALTAGGHTLSWGAGGHGRLGHGHEEHQLLPELVQALRDEDVLQISAGRYHSVVRLASGEVRRTLRWSSNGWACLPSGGSAGVTAVGHEGNWQLTGSAGADCGQGNCSSALTSKWRRARRRANVLVVEGTYICVYKRSWLGITSRRSRRGLRRPGRGWRWCSARGPAARRRRCSGR